MASLNFKGKNAVWNHHLSVPYQALQKDNKLSLKGKNEDENLIIEADNLVALKSLLPKYQGRVNCIYIDPPYNTENDAWVYNDKVNSPLIKEWLHKTVNKDDLTRHDKWLCMMTPRLKLLHDLLADDGIIFISIDDNEANRLKELAGEIFGEKNFITQFVWEKTQHFGRQKNNFYSNCEYILVFAKKLRTNNLLREFLVEKIQSEFEDAPLYNTSNRTNNLIFPAGKVVFNIEDGVYSETSNEKYKLLDKVEIKDGKNKNDLHLAFQSRWSQKNVDAEIKKGANFWVKSNGFAIRVIYGEDKVFKDSPKQIIFTNNNNPFVAKNRFGQKVGTTEDGSSELKNLFGGKEIFSYPKPSSLIKYLISLYFNPIEDDYQKDFIVLDSFAGSGTTAQAVLELNKKDKGNRKFILVQLPEKIEKDTPAYKAGFKYVHEITRERVKRVIEIEKLKAGFSYMKLGPKIDADSILSGKLPTYRELAEYVYYLATGKTMDNKKSIKEADYFAGKTNGESIYLIYKKDFEKLKGLAITLDWAEKTNKKDKGKKIVYAPACFLDEEQLEKFNISFVSIPYSLFDKQK